MANFEQCIKRSRSGEEYTVTCIKELWTVSSHDKDFADELAKHYFWQYESDGEYD